MKPSFVIRAGEEADIEPCLALALLATPEKSGTEMRDWLRRDVEEPERWLVVAETASDVVGYGRARLFVPGPDAPADSAPHGYYLTGVFVLPEERREGIGAALTQERIHWISERADEAWFFTDARNRASIGLHRRCGFEEVTRRFSFPNAAFDDGEGILFRLRIRPGCAGDVPCPESSA
jgi:ribosomal protein S18 acetylase RimI-like enzyme